MHNERITMYSNFFGGNNRLGRSCSQEAINDAIDSGVECLLKKQNAVVAGTWLDVLNGASYIVRQQKDGHWNDIVTTCFALLFLVKGTLPTEKMIRIITPSAN